MKKAIVTLLGMISYSKPDYIIIDNKIKKISVDIKDEERATYQFSNELKKFSNLLNRERYINTLHLLIDAFEEERYIIPIATDKAKNIQEKTLKFLKIDNSCLDKTIIIDEFNYEKIFQKISKLLQEEEYESFIIDLTHGFRHLPILMIVNLIIASIKDIDKIEHIFFAKEITPMKEYEIIDLLDYIGLAKFSFVLENFNTNYTVGNKLIFKNEKYQDLVDNLRIISGHILANSLKALIEDNESLIQQTIKKLETLQQEDKNIATFSISIQRIIKHLERMDNLKNEKDYIKLFKFSQIMLEREYLLNSITLLNESIGMYCAEEIRKISPEISAKIDNFIKKEEFSSYKLSHQSKNLIKLKYKFNGDYLSELLPKNDILQALGKQNQQKLIELIVDIENLRNNLTHGNSSEKIENVKGKISSLLKRYQGISLIPNDIDIEEKNRELRKKANSVKKKSKKKRPKPQKGITASKEKVDRLKNLFDNR